jgi:hypothetical protein
MHRLVHMASDWWLKGHEERTAWTKQAVARLQDLIPHGGHERKEVWTGYFSHALHVARLDGTLEETAKASLLDRAGRCQSSLGQYSVAEMTHRQVLLLRQRNLGGNDTQTLTSMNEVGILLIKQGKYNDAESINRETLFAV